MRIWMKFDLALGLCYRFRAPVKKAQNRVNQISDLTLMVYY